MLDFIKKHALILGGSLLLIVVVYFTMESASTSQTSSSDTTNSYDQQLAAQMQAESEQQALDTLGMGSLQSGSSSVTNPTVPAQTVSTAQQTLPSYTAVNLPSNSTVSDSTTDALSDLTSYETAAGTLANLSTQNVSNTTTTDTVPLPGENYPNATSTPVTPPSTPVNNFATTVGTRTTLPTTSNYSSTLRGTR